MDPIERTLRWIFDLNKSYPQPWYETLVLIQCVGVLVILACIFRKNFVGHEERLLEKKYSALCGALIGRMHAIVPVYNESFNRFHTMVAERCMQHPTLDLAKELSSMAIEDAERDLYHYDVHNVQTLSLLYMQLEGLTQTQEGHSHGLA